MQLRLKHPPRGHQLILQGNQLMLSGGNPRIGEGCYCTGWDCAAACWALRMCGSEASAGVVRVSSGGSGVGRGQPFSNMPVIPYFLYKYQQDVKNNLTEEKNLK
jgi:hypothetical protein